MLSLPQQIKSLQTVTETTAVKMQNLQLQQMIQNVGKVAVINNCYTILIDRAKQADEPFFAVARAFRRMRNPPFELLLDDVQVPAPHSLHQNVSEQVVRFRLVRVAVLK